MNKEWSEQNKSIQTLIRKDTTYNEGINKLFKLRSNLFDVLCSLKQELDRADFDAMPYINANGYHNKNIAYSIWHIFRIEDIVAHSLIKRDEQIFFSGNFSKHTKSPIITTGNELEKQEIAAFSKQLDLNGLYAYAFEVKASTEELLKELSFGETKKKISAEQQEYLKSLNVVAPDENAVWLIDYWCGKDIRGLIQMPFSRRWIMHTEAILRIKAKIKK